MFLAPAITMSLFSEELKSGTLELLLTSPLTTIQITLGKYLASLAIIITILLLTVIYGISIYYLASPTGNIDIAALVGSYIGLLLLAALFLAIGLSVSALTRNQIVAFLIGTLLCFLLYQGFDAWSTLKTWEDYSVLIAQLGILYHYEALSRGVIDLRDVLYFCSASCIPIMFINLMLKER
jgi:ABC-2 type transport system permease protein